MFRLRHRTLSPLLLIGALGCCQAVAEALAQPRIVHLESAPSGVRIFHLDNGEVWAQEAPQFMTVAAGEAVIIAPARLGGMLLTTEHSATTRVRQLPAETTAQQSP